jgi:hypothetical protein
MIRMAINNPSPRKKPTRLDKGLLGAVFGALDFDFSIINPPINDIYNTTV